MATAIPPPPKVTDATPADKPPRVKKPKHTYMLHNPDDMTSLGKYVSTDYRYAALKVASRGHRRILLRRTNSKEIREFEGEVVPLDKPKIIHRAGASKPIEYHRKPSVKFVKAWTFAGLTPELLETYAA